MNSTELARLGVEPQEVEKGAYKIRLTSNSQSLEILSRLAKEYAIHPRIRALVAELLASCKEKDYDCYIQQITDFVKKNVKYVNDPPRAEVFQSPLRTLEWGIGDCDDFAVLTASLLLSAGLNARPVIKRVNDRWGHVVVEVFHPERKEWLEIDTTDKEGNMEPVYELGLIDPVDEINETPEELPEDVAELGRRGFTGRRWIIRKVPTARHPGAPVIYYKELWYYRNGRPVRRLRRIRWKVVRPHVRTLHRVRHVRAHRPTHTEAGILSKSTLPLLLGAGALIYLLKRK